jgi:hypothetical protein
MLDPVKPLYVFLGRGAVRFALEQLMLLARQCVYPLDELLFVQAV